MLLRVDGPAGHRHHSLDEGAAPLLAGRGSDAGIHLPDAMRSISRRHLSFVREGNAVRVTVVSEALGAQSSRGDLLPGASCLLGVGDHVSIGIYRVTVLLPEPRSIAPAPEPMAVAPLPVPPLAPMPMPDPLVASPVGQPLPSPPRGGIAFDSTASGDDLLGLIQPIQTPATPADLPAGQEYWVVPQPAPAPWAPLPTGPDRAARDGSAIDAVDRAIGRPPVDSHHPAFSIEAFISGGGPSPAVAAPDIHPPAQHAEPPIRVTLGPSEPHGYARSSVGEPPLPAAAGASVPYAAPPPAAAVPKPLADTGLSEDPDDALWRDLVNLAGGQSFTGQAQAPDVPKTDRVDPLHATAQQLVTPAPLLSQPPPPVLAPDERRAPTAPAEPPKPATPSAAPRSAPPLAETAPASPADPIARTRQAQDEGASAIAALSAGLGIPLPPQLTPAQWQHLGATLRALVDGYCRLLMTRDDVRSTLGVPGRTEMFSHDNNPLKIRATPAERLALLALGSSGSHRYMSSNDAIDEATEDLTLHNMALIAACRVAMEELVRDFDPSRLQTEIGRGKGIPYYREAQLWNRYCEHYRSQSEHMADWLQRLFDKHFVNAYSRGSDRPQRARPSGR